MSDTRSRPITRTDPSRTRFQLRGLDGYGRLAAMKRGDASPPPAGTMHGGVIATLVDTAMGCAVSSTLPADAGFTTLELRTNFVRAITQATERVHAEGRVVHRGGRAATTEARVYDDAGTLYTHAKSTCLVQGGAR